MLKKISIGMIAGLISGIFSTGGGMILVPALIYILKMDNVKARATSITCILPMVITSSFFYAGNNYLNWNIGLQCALGGIIGGVIGAKCLKKIPDFILKLSFAIFLSYMAIKMI